MGREILTSRNDAAPNIILLFDAKKDEEEEGTTTLGLPDPRTDERANGGNPTPLFSSQWGRGGEEREGGRQTRRSKILYTRLSSHFIFRGRPETREMKTNGQRTGWKEGTFFFFARRGKKFSPPASTTPSFLFPSSLLLHPAFLPGFLSPPGQAKSCLGSALSKYEGRGIREGGQQATQLVVLNN